MEWTSRNTWLSIYIILFTVTVTYFVKRRNKSSAMFKGQLPPMVNAITLLGLIPTLFHDGLQRTINCLYIKFGCVFTINIFGLKVTFLIGPEVSSHFYQGQHSEISHGNMLEFAVPMFGQEVGYGVDPAIRNDQQRLLVDALRPSNLRRHVDTMIQEVEDYFAKWGPQGIVDLKEELDQLLMLISTRYLLGREIREKMLPEVNKQFGELSNGMNFISMLFPYIPISSNNRRDKAHMKLRKLFSEIMIARKRSNRVEEDVLQTLMDSKHKDGRPTTEGEVIGMVMTLLFAGKHSSSVTSTWTGAFLLSHVDFLLAAIEEQNQIMKKYGDDINYDILLKMDILHRCIKEALRIHPAAKINFRKVHKNFTVRTKEGNEYDIPEGHTLISPTIFNNVIPYIYKDPHVYDPERFSPGREEDKVGGRFSYTSFGGGRHACIGENYAYMQIKVIWSHLLRNFDLQLVSPFPKMQGWKQVDEPAGKVMVSYKRHHVLAS